MHQGVPDTGILSYCVADVYAVQVTGSQSQKANHFLTDNPSEQSLGNRRQQVQCSSILDRVLIHNGVMLQGG